MRVPFRWPCFLLVASALALTFASSCADTPVPPVPPVPPTAADDESSGPPIFVDRAAESGLDFMHWNGMSGELYFVEMAGVGGALVDFDNDGDLDVFLPQGHMLGVGKTEADATFPPPPGTELGDRLYRNDLEVGDTGDSRGLRFTDVTRGSGLPPAGYGMGVAVGDFDNDGWPDLYITRFGENRLLRNFGGVAPMTFEDVTLATGTGDARWSVSAAFVDVDHDGWLDLYVGNYVAYSLDNHQPCRNLLGARDYCGPHAYEPEPDRLFRNLGPGADGTITFEDIALRSGLGRPAAGLGVVAADLNADGWLDLYVANDGMPNQMWINRGSSAEERSFAGLIFEDRALLAGAAVNAKGEAEASMGVDVADIDLDGDEDLFMTHLGRETHTLYLNDGQGTFTDSTPTSGLAAASWEATGFGTVLIDYDNDGLLDLVAVNGAVKAIEELAAVGDAYPIHQPNQLFRNEGQGVFVEVSREAGPAFGLSEVSRGATVGDIDNDGDADLLVSNNNGPVQLLVNQVGQDQPWLGLRLVGTTGRDMLGAWAGLHREGGPSLWRRVTTTGSYASARDPRLLFGLGDSAAVDVVEVRWPSGRKERFTNVAVGRYSTLVEGTGAVH